MLVLFLTDPVHLFCSLRWFSPVRKHLMLEVLKRLYFYFMLYNWSPDSHNLLQKWTLKYLAPKCLTLVNAQEYTVFNRDHSQ